MTALETTHSERELTTADGYRILINSRVTKFEDARTSYRTNIKFMIPCHWGDMINVDVENDYFNSNAKKVEVRHSSGGKDKGHAASEYALAMTTGMSLAMLVCQMAEQLSLSSFYNMVINEWEDCEFESVAELIEQLSPADPMPTPESVK